mmetsp:Transcript_28087/g.24816  ORF Transcript_28087/g.24816 Transcript_28087/m.24816 type:complete len:187 (+) Transcript_28087:200-760(+)
MKDYLSTDEFFKIKSINPVGTIRNIRMKKRLFQRATEARKKSSIIKTNMQMDLRINKIITKISKKHKFSKRDSSVPFNKRTIDISKNSIKLGKLARYQGFLSPHKLHEKLNNTGINFKAFSPRVKKGNIYSPITFEKKKIEQKKGSFFIKRQKMKRISAFSSDRIIEDAPKDFFGHNGIRENFRKF